MRLSKAKFGALAGVSALVLAGLTVAPVVAEEAVTPEPVKSGEGFRLYPDLYKFDPTDTWTIDWGSVRARDLLKDHVTVLAGELETVLGNEFVVTDSIDELADDESCGTRPGPNRITIAVEFQPVGKRGTSRAWPCRNLDYEASGGWIKMDSEYWDDPTWFSTNPARNLGYAKNLTTHEVLHVLGLGHPNREGEPYNCVDGSVQPTACSPNGGWKFEQVEYHGGEMTAWDMNGLLTLVRNWEAANGA